MKTILTAFLLMLALIPCNAGKINVKEHATTHQGCPRMPSISKLSVEIENGIITTYVAHFSGVVEINIYNDKGVGVDYKASYIESNGSIAMDETGLPEGDYTIEIGLGDTVYEGEFSI